MTWYHVEDRLVRARRSHRCALCNRNIPVNTPYVRRFGWENRRPVTCAMHTRCERAARDWDDNDWLHHNPGEGTWPEP